MKSKASVRKILAGSEMIVFYIILTLSIIIGLVNPAFFGIRTLIDISRSMIVVLIFALCEMIVIVSGGIDVSFPAIASFSMYFTTKFMIANGLDSVPLAFAMAAGIGLLLGLINAVLIGTFKIPTLIATLGTSSLINGALLAFVGVNEIMNLPKNVDALSKGYLFSVQNSSGLLSSMSSLIILPVVLCILVWFLLNYTMLGRSIKAVGGDINAAYRAGFNVVKTQYFIYMFVGAIVGIGGMAHTVLMRNSNPVNLMGSEMMVIAAVVIGGARITGGYGNVVGTILGVLLITLVTNNLILLGVPNYWQKFVVGMIIIIGVSISSLRAKRIALNPKIRRCSSNAKGK